MNPEDKTLFDLALRKTRTKGAIVAVICLSGLALPLLVTSDPTASSGTLVATSVLAALMVVVGIAVGYVNVIKAPAKVARLVRTLESSPEEIVALSVTVHATRGQQQVTLTEAEALASPPGLGAQWRVEVKVRDEKISLIAGGQDLAQRIAAVIRRRAPMLAAAA